MVGPLPKSSMGYQYILAATDYFSKWAEAAAYREVKRETVATFVKKKNIITVTVFRVASSLIMKNSLI